MPRHSRERVQCGDRGGPGHHAWKALARGRSPVSGGRSLPDAGLLRGAGLMALTGDFADAAGLEQGGP